MIRTHWRPDESMLLQQFGGRGDRREGEPERAVTASRSLEPSARLSTHSIANWRSGMFVPPSARYRPRRAELGFSVGREVRHVRLRSTMARTSRAAPATRASARRNEVEVVR